MRKQAYAAAALVCCLTVVPGPAVASPRPGARQRYAEVNRELRRCTRVTRDLSGYSTEGGSLTGYFRGSAPRKLVARFYGEMGKATEEYYFWDNRLFFVLRVDLNYDRPFGKVRSRTENRWYFGDGKLIRWIDPGSKMVPLSTDQARRRQQEILAMARDLLAMARQQLHQRRR